MSARGERRKPRPTASVDAQVRIEAQRQQLFKASAVVDMCRYACASTYDGFDPEQLAVALVVVYELVDNVAVVLKNVADGRGSHGEDVAAGD